MSYNTFSYNTTSYNTLAGDIAIQGIISESFTAAEALTGLAKVNLFSGIEVAEALSSQLTLSIREILTTSAALTSSSDRSMTLSDSVTMSDQLLISFSVTLAEDLETADTLAGVLKAYKTVIEAISIADATLTSSELVATASEIFTIASTILLDLVVEVIQDGITTADTIVEIHNLGVALAEALSMDDTPEDSVSIYAITAENLSVDDVESLQIDYNVLVEDTAAFIVTIKSGDFTYQGIVMHPANFGITEYTNYNFNSSAHFDSTYLLANENGLYQVDGTTDAGDYITARIKTATVDLGTSSMKQVPKVYLGIDSDANLILNVSVDGSSTSTYELALDTQSLTNQMFDIGKGLVGRYWQFELQTKENSNLFLDEIEIFPLVFGRKRR